MPSLYALLSLTATVTNLLFAIFVLFKNPESRLNRIWFFVILCLVLWGSGEFVLRITSDLDTAKTVSRISGIGFCLIPALFLHFTLEFSDQRTALRNRRLYAGIYVPGVLFSFLQAAGLITTVTHLKWGFATTPTTGYLIYLVWLELFFLTGLYLCYRKFKWSRSQRERNQAAFVILGVTIPLLIGSINDALFPLMGIETLRVAVVTTTVTAGLLAYAIVKFQLMSLTPQTTAVNILQTMGDLLAVANVDGFIEYTNTALKKFLQRESHGAQRLHLRDFIEEYNLVTGKIQEIQHPSEPSELLHVHYKDHSSNSLQVSLLISCIYDKGELVGYVLLARDVTEEIRLQRQLDEVARLHTENLERFATAIQGAQEDERRRIARELHDDICQRLSAMKLRLELFSKELPMRQRKSRTELRTVQQEIDRIVVEMRRMSSNLRPSTLDDLGLVAALRLLCRKIETTHRVKISFHPNGSIPEHFEGGVEIAVYRIAQEALQNIAKHAHATNASIELNHQEGRLELHIRDNGRGFSPQKNAEHMPLHHGLGMITMKERSELLGGTFEIDSLPQHGTRVSVILPVKSYDEKKN